MSVLEAQPTAVDEQARVGERRHGRSDYWLKHSEGFQVFGPNGRIGFVALVLSSDEGVDGLVIRTGLFRTRSVFVPVHEVGAVASRRKRLELRVAPRVPRARPSDIIRELIAGTAEPLSRQDGASVGRASDGRR